MRIKVWGCRGSLPAPGPETLRYGGETTCLEVRSGPEHCMVVDAGSGIRRLGRALVEDPDVSNISLLLTHSHWDHIMGFPFFEPAYDARFSIALCGGPRGQRSVWEYLTHQLEAPYFPVDPTALSADFRMGCTCDRSVCDGVLPLTDGAVRCHPVPMSHPNGGVGFRFVHDGKTLVFLPDNELGYCHEGGPARDAFVETCRGIDLLLHDAQYTEEEYERKRGWGHSTIDAAVELAMEAGVKRLGLFHHDPDRTDDQIDREVDRCRDRIVRAGADLDCFACADGMSIDL